MKKTFLIGIKDVKLAFRDRSAIILMLLAPFLLTLGMGFVTGRLSDSGTSSGLSDITVVIVNQDKDILGNALVKLFTSSDLDDLLEPTESNDLQAARQLIDNDKAAAVILIPSGFTQSIFSPNPDTNPEAVSKIELYANPTRSVSVGVIQTIVESFISQVEVGRVGGQVAITQLIRAGLINPSQAPALGAEIGERSAVMVQESAMIHLNSQAVGEAPVEFDVLAYMAPGMALMFLMFTVSYGGRSILAERNQGTLPRLLISPTSIAQVLGGKVLGIFLTGVLQIIILIAACAVLFNLNWGEPASVLLLVLASVFGATGWGMLLTAFARTPSQVSSLGSALMLTFGILGGSFFSLENLPKAIQWVSKITPNAWGIEGFTKLAQGATLAEIGMPLFALVLMGVVLFVAAVLIFNRQAILQK